MKKLVSLILACLPVFLFAETPPWEREHCTRIEIVEYLTKQPSILVKSSSRESTQLYDYSAARNGNKEFFVKHDYSTRKFGSFVYIAWGTKSGKTLTMYIPINIDGKYVSYKSRSDIQRHIINKKVRLQWDSYEGDWVK